MFRFVIFLAGLVLICFAVPVSANQVYNCTIQQYFDLNVDMKSRISEADSARLVKYVKWLYKNRDQKGTPEYTTVLRAYRELDAQAHPDSPYVDGPLKGRMKRGP